MSRIGAGDRATVPLGREFHLLWTGQSVSFVGDRITFFVVPAVVVLLLGGSAFDVGVISTAQYLAIPLLSLAAGALADRWDLRQMMIGCDLVRFAAIGVLPVAYLLGLLTLPLLFFCVVVVSVATVFFQVGYMPAMAATVPKTELVRANSRIETSRTLSELTGPAAAGGLYQVLGVGAMVVSAVTYLASAVAIRAMRPFGERSVGGVRVLARSLTGMRLNWADPILRKSTAGTLLSNIGGPIFVTQMPVLAYQGLGMSAGTFGLVMSIAAGGALLGAVTAAGVSRRIGSGSMMGLSMVAHSLSGVGILLAPRYPALVVLALTLSSYGFFAAWYDINSASIRQARVPIRDQSVVHGAYRTITWGVIPVSVIVGGWVVDRLSQHLPILDAAKYTMLVATLIGVSAIIPLARMERLLATSPPMETEPPGDPATVDDAGRTP